MIPIACIALLICLQGPARGEQAASVEGRIDLLVAVGAKKPLSRGSLYRSRQTPSSRVSEDGQTEAPPYESVIVSARPLSFEPELEPLEGAVEVEQVGVAFRPHVVPVTPGTVVEFINHDGIYHNVFSLTPGARFNIGRKPTGEVVSRRIEVVGAVDLFCDIHPQMHAVILSLDTPYFARADREGRYLLAGLPPGTYEVRAYHPDLRGVPATVELAPGQRHSLDFRLGE